MKQSHVLFVCSGNICRSPTAEGILLAKIAEHELLEHVTVDSAGLNNYHQNDPPDLRAQATAKRYGIDLSSLRARALVQQDFERFTDILYMTKNHERLLCEHCPPMHRKKIANILNFAPEACRYDEVPDPYYGAGDGFDIVFDLLDTAVEGLVIALKKRHCY